MPHNADPVDDVDIWELERMNKETYMIGLENMKILSTYSAYNEAWWFSTFISMILSLKI